jgi:predicted acylesterase/phospholipase RssA
VTSRRNIAITFAGGGNRAFYQLGLLHAWEDRLRPRTAAIAAVSAGACVATLWLTGRERITRDFWRARRSGVSKNFDWGQVLRGKSPAPHGPIYRDTLLCAYADGGLQRVQAAPFPIWVLTAAFPKVVPAAAGAMLGFGAYNLEKRFDPTRVHGQAARKLGFRPKLVDARDCTSAEELADLVIASSSTPPFTPVGMFRGERLLDGSLVDNVPADAAERSGDIRGNLVLLTRPYPATALGAHRRRTYVAPTKAVPIERWDYTRPDLLDDTIAMGEAEAEHHRPLLDDLLAR